MRSDFLAVVDALSTTNRPLLSPILTFGVLRRVRASFGSGSDYDRAIDAETATRRWIDAWARGWSQHDSSVIAPLYHDDAIFVSAPFREPKRGGPGAAEYAEWAFASEEQVEVWFAEPLVASDGAAVRYWAIVRDRDGRDSTLAGISALRFHADGRVVEQRDHWHQETDVARTPPDDWGPVAAHARSDTR